MRSIRERLQAMEPSPLSQSEAASTGVPIDVVAPGVERFTDHGSHYLVDTWVPDPTRGEFLERCVHIPSRFIRSGHAPDLLSPSDVLFLDTETTGLDRGIGTHVFLVGVGYFDREGFTVRQYFIRDLHEEPSLLHDLHEFLSQFPVMLTFNGRSFDWPLLYNRFILHGYRDFPEFAHWDLLPSSRRVWKQRLRDCSLGNLERRILGVQRFGDVPGYLIPQLYFDYLRTRDARPLRPVFSHNQEDIVSLARLADRLLAAEIDPLLALEHPVDRLCLGLSLLTNDQPARGAALIREHLDDPLADDNLRGRAYRALAEDHKRRREWPEAIDLWERMDRHNWRSPELALYPLTELAKAYEHRVPDFDAALQYAERALNLVSIRGWHEYRAELMHRYARIRRKMKSGILTGVE